MTFPVGRDYGRLQYKLMPIQNPQYIKSVLYQLQNYSGVSSYCLYGKKNKKDVMGIFVKCWQKLQVDDFYRLRGLLAQAPYGPRRVIKNFGLHFGGRTVFFVYGSFFDDRDLTLVKNEIEASIIGRQETFDSLLLRSCITKDVVLFRHLIENSAYYISETSLVKKIMTSNLLKVFLNKMF